VALAVTGALNNWQASVSPASANVNDGDSLPVTVTVAVPAFGTAGNATLTLTATAGQESATANITMAVANNVVIPIAAGTSSGAHNFPMLTVNVGTTITWMNYDSTPHRIHAAGADGINHEPSDMNEGDSYQQTASSAGDAPFYCHDHGPGAGTGNIHAQ
jgi:plastocyanin